MKKIISAILPISILLSSCSDNLTNTKADKIMKDCFKDVPNTEAKSIKIGKELLLDDTTLERYKKLEDQGYMKLKDTLVKGGITNRDLYKVYTVSLTNKSKPLIEETDERRSVTWVKMRTNSVEFDKVLDIREIPANNNAEVRVQFKRTNKTPFFIFSNAEDSETNSLEFKKTDKGWKLCD